MSVSIFWNIPLSIYTASPSRISNQDKVLLTLERHSCTWYKQESALSPKSRSWQDSARNHLNPKMFVKIAPTNARKQTLTLVLEVRL